MDITERKKRNNKGLTLLEVLIAVCLFAIVLAPISASLLTALKINIRSRQLLTATDVAQTLMESFSEKTYEECKNTVTALGGTLATGFASIDEGYYNQNANSSGIPWSSVSSYITLNSVGQTTITDPDTGAVLSKSNKLWINDSEVINKIYARVLKTVCADKKLYYTVSPGGEFMYIGYTGINAKGMTFDAVVSFLPVPNASDDHWYTYVVFVDVYQYKGETAADRLTKPTVSLKSGILWKARL